MRVLSLFDGMSCGQLALEKVGINVDLYIASEVDKHAKQITRKNYPNTIHLGDVKQIKGFDFPKIDLLIGGSPCQGFSFAGKQLNFDDPRSVLFFEFVRLLKETKPKYFLLENVRMKQEYQDVISEHLGVKPIMINSALVSAQNRVRLYWTNIPNITQPEDKGIILRDILEGCVDPKYYAGKKLIENYQGGDQLNPNYKSQANTIHRDKSATLCAGTHGYANGYVEGRPCEPYERKKVLCGRIVGRKINPETGKHDDYNPNIKTVQRFEERFDEKSGCLTTVQKDNVLLIKEATKKGYTEIQDGDCFDATFPNSKTRRGRNMKDKCNCLTAANYDYMRYEHPTYRKLTPLECERLQTVPDGYTEGVSNTQRYKMLGNGWTVDVIAHIFKGISQEYCSLSQEVV